MRKTVMLVFWCDYATLKYGKKAKLSYMDTDSFMVYIKKEDTYTDIAKNAETRFNISN